MAAVLGLTAPAWAQTPEEPGRGVARISLINGDVSVRRGDSGDYVAAALNAPLVVQDRVVTGPVSRAEIQLDWANFLRLSHNAEVRLAELEWERYMVQIARGTATWSVLRDSEARIEISTPTVSVRPVRKGTYRVTVFEDGTTQVTVRSGEAEIYTPRGSERLRSGRTMFVRGTVSDPEFRIGEEIADDDWDRWNIARDRDLGRSRSYQYMSRDIYGAEDLDDHGRWMHVASYGWVWSPRVAGGWAPYRHGRWSWIDWYGWSWVSYDPWGWAPYHYGRWFYHAPVGWCWWPGAIGRRHYWSPGFVAFVGFGRVGAGVGIGGGWGRVGWIPLAPHEPFHPWYGRRWYGGYRNPGYIDNSVTVVNNVNVTNIYRNARINDAVTVVDNDGFRRGRFDNRILVSTDDIRTASLARGPLPVTPERASLRLADRETSVRGIERAGGERFFSNRTPAQVERVSFEDQRRGVEQIARRSFGQEEARAAGVEGGRTVTDGARGESAAEQRGWRRAGEAENGASVGRGADSGRGVSAGEWRRSGDAAPAGARSADAARSADESGRGASTDDRQRVGEAAPAGVRSADGARSSDESGRGASTGDWRRFGSSRAESAGSARGGDTPRGDSGRGASTGDWRSFGSSRAESAGSVRGGDTPRGDSGRGAPTGDWRSSGSSRAESAGSVRGGDTPGGDSGRGAPTGDWRRFGSPRIENNDAGRGAGGDRGFGEPVSPREAPGRSAPSGDSRRPDSDRGAGVSPSSGGRNFNGSGDWMRFEGNSGGRSESQVSSGSGRDSADWRRTAPAPSYDRGAESPRMEPRDRNGSWGGSRGGDRSDSIRISPSIVRERGSDFGGSRSWEGSRSAPSGGSRDSFGGGMRSGGGSVSGGRSAPSSQSGGGRGGSDGGSRGGGGRGR